MLTKFISLIASFLMLFEFAFPAEPPLKVSRDVLKESQPQYDSQRRYDKINGVKGTVFYIARPYGELSEVNASQFGMSPENKNNHNAFMSALKYCRTHPGTKLKIDSGTYYFDNRTMLQMNGFKNILIEGDNTTLVLSNVVGGLWINNSDCVEIKNIKFDWDWEKHSLSDIFRVENASTKTNSLDFVFPELDDVDENMIIAAITQCDPETLTYGAKYSNKEVYVYQQPEMIKSVTKTDKNVLHVEYNGGLDRFKNGETYILRHYVYDTRFATVCGESKNITFDGISVFGYPGSGFVFEQKSSHYQMINSYIGVNPEKKNVYHTSLGSDAIHIANSDGCFNISNCDISGQGDDALNVHDGLGWVKNVDGNKIKLVASAMYIRKGDVLKFRDERFNETDVSATVTSLEFHSDGTYYDIEFDRDISEVGVDYIAYNTSCCSDNYVISNNYIHENRARGFLLQNSNGLCENNKFYKTQMQAIKIVMDIEPGLWYEGTGVDRLVIRGNSFEECDYVSTGEVITIGSNIGGRPATSQPFTNIEIVNNTFSEMPERVLNANNVNGLVFSGNVINAGKSLPKNPTSARACFDKHCSNITFENNLWANCFLGEIAKAKTIYNWARINSK